MGWGGDNNKPDALHWPDSLQDSCLRITHKTKTSEPPYRNHGCGTLWNLYGLLVQDPRFRISTESMPAGPWQDVCLRPSARSIMFPPPCLVGSKIYASGSNTRSMFEDPYLSSLNCESSTKPSLRIIYKIQVSDLSTRSMFHVTSDTKISVTSDAKISVTSEDLTHQQWSTVNRTFTSTSWMFPVVNTKIHHGSPRIEGPRPGLHRGFLAQQDLHAWIWFG